MHILKWPLVLVLLYIAYLLVVHAQSIDVTASPMAMIFAGLGLLVIAIIVFLIVFLNHKPSREEVAREHQELSVHKQTDEAPHPPAEEMPPFAG